MHCRLPRSGARNDFAFESGRLRAILCTLHRGTIGDAGRNLDGDAPRAFGQGSGGSGMIDSQRKNIFRMSLTRATFLLAALLTLAGCKSTPATVQPAAPLTQPAPAAAPALAPVEPAAISPETSTRPSGPIEFTDITAQAGIHFKHNSGAFGKKYLPETMGS